MRETIIGSQTTFELDKNEGLSVYIVHPEIGNMETVTAVVDNNSNMIITSRISSPTTSVYGERNTEVSASGMNAFGTTTHEGNEIVFIRKEQA